MADWSREPSLDEILGDPVIISMMSRDKVDPLLVRELLCSISGKRRQLKAGNRVTPARCRC